MIRVTGFPRQSCMAPQIDRTGGPDFGQAYKRGSTAYDYRHRADSVVGACPLRGQARASTRGPRGDPLRSADGIPHARTATSFRYHGTGN